MIDSAAMARQHKWMLDSYNYSMNRTMEAIRAELDQLVIAEGLMMNGERLEEGEVKTVREEIKDRIASIDQHLDKNKDRIDELIKSVENSGRDNRKLKAQLAEAKTSILRHEETIASLYDALENESEAYVKLDQGFQRLMVQNDSLGQHIEALNDEIHTAYYTQGSARDLRKDGVLEREGGILTLGSTHVLEDDFNEDRFVAIDIREQQRIRLRSEKADIVTEHPTNSYEIIEGDEVAYLEIKDPDSFWKASKFMVIQTK